jgi:hypothetical protein
MADLIISSLRGGWKREHLAWAAGLFEGEGSFTCRRQLAHRYWSMQAELGMSDEDRVRQFHRVVGIGNVTGPHPNGKANWKPMYRWKVGSFEGVQMVVVLLWDWLGPRRKAKAKELLTGYMGYTNVRRFTLATPADVEEVRRLLSEGIPKRKVATMVGRSYGYVNHIKRGRTHAEIAP